MTKHHIKELFSRRSDAEVTQAHQPAPMSAEEIAQDQAEDERSLDLVQRVVASSLVIVVAGGIAVLLGLTAALGLGGLDGASRFGLWIMSGITGMVAVAGVMLINRRHLYSPLVLIGLLPMAVAGFWLL